MTSIEDLADALIHRADQARPAPDLGRVVRDAARLSSQPPRDVGALTSIDPGLEIARVRAKTTALREKCRQRNILFDVRPKVHDRILDNYEHGQ